MIDTVAVPEAYVEYEKITGTPLETTVPQKAMFYYFKPSGKYYTDCPGFVPPTNEIWTRAQLLEINEGVMPGLAGPGNGFRIVIIPDPEELYGWPQIKEPVNG